MVVAIANPPTEDADRHSSAPQATAPDVGTATEATASTTTSTTTTTIPLSPDEQAILDGNVALCGDGGYSDNDNFSATCSSGRGIDHWLGNFGECNDGRIIAMDSDSSCTFNDGFKTVLPVDFVLEPSDSDVALCRDGTYSDNEDFSGTCSSSQGVAEWLAEWGECSDGTIIRMSGSASCGDFVFRSLLPGYSPPATTTTTTTVYVLTEEEQIEIAELAFEIVFASVRTEAAEIIDTLDGVSVDRFVYSAVFDRVVLDLSTELDSEEIAWAVTKGMARFWSDDDGAWYLDVWTPGFNVTVNGRSFNCDGETMVELGSFRVGRSAWEGACT